MPAYQFNRQIGPALLDRLVAAGFPPETPVAMAGATCWITCAPEEYDRAAAVVAAYDQGALDATEAAERDQDTAATQTARAAVADLATARDFLAGTATLNLTNARPILLLLVRAQLAVLRLLLRRGVV